jgi:vitamin B12 transporter
MTAPAARMAALAVVVVVVAGSGPLAAQQPGDTIVLDSVVVTATRLPLPRAAVSSAVTVLSGEALRERGITDLLGALRGVPGAVLVQGGTFGTPASLFLRGGESDYVKVLVDGVAVNDPGGAFDFAHLTIDDVERVEVVRGPASVLYGSDAVAGVVQVFTRPGRGAPRWRIGGGGGTFGTRSYEAGVAGGSARAGFSLSGSRSASDGTYAFNSGYRRDEVAGLVRASVGSRTDARFTFRLDGHTAHFPTDGAGRLVDRNQFTTGRQTTVGVEARHVLGPRLELRLQLGSNAAVAGYDDRSDGAADTLGFYADRSVGRTVRRSADLRAVAYVGAGTTVTLGGALERQSDRSIDSAASQFGPFADTLIASRRNGALYAQMVADPGGRVAFNAGARVDRNQRFGSAATYRAGLSWRAARGARLRAAVGTALKEPTFYEQYASGFVQGNPALRPERDRSWEVGAEVLVGRGGPSLSGTWFSQRFSDLIQYTAVPPAPGDPNYFNIAAATSSGLELESTIAIGSGLTALAHYTYLSTAVRDAGFETADDGPFAEGRPLLRRPAHAAGGGLSLARNGVVLWGDAELVGRREDMDYAGAAPVRVVLPAYFRVDASATVPLVGRGGAAGLVATVRIENVLGARYEEARGFPARGRTLFAGLRAGGGFR